jgi:hypothetical protein
VVRLCAMADLLRLGGDEVGGSLWAGALALPLVRILLSTGRNLVTLALERRKTASETSNRTGEVLLSPVA